MNRLSIPAMMFLISSQPGAPVLHHAGETIRLRSGDAMKFVVRLTPNTLPAVRLLDERGKTLFAVSIGKDEKELFEVPEEADGHNPLVEAFSVEGPAANLDVIVPIVMVSGGSDCGYEATVIGITDNRPKEWLSRQAFVNSQGGYYVGDLGSGRGYGFATWNFLWEDGTHYGVHRYEVTLYRFQPQRGEAVQIAHLETRGKYATSTEALRSLGLNYSNLFRLDPRFKC